MATKNELEKSKVRKETTAKFFFDMAKLTFAALVLGVAASLLNREIEDEIPFCDGIHRYGCLCDDWI